MVCERTISLRVRLHLLPFRIGLECRPILLRFLPARVLETPFDKRFHVPAPIACDAPVEMAVFRVLLMVVYLENDISLARKNPIHLTALGSDNERSQSGRHVPDHAPTVASSVLNQDIAGRQRHLLAFVELECQAAGENDPEIRRVGPVKASVSSTEFVAILEVHLGSGFWCNEVSRQVRPDDEADATYGREYTGRRRIVPRVRVACGLIRIPEEGELS